MNVLITALLVIPMIIIIATAVFNMFSTNIDQSGWGTAANDTLTKVTTGTWSGFKLSAMLPFIYIAMAIVGIVMSIFVGKQLG